MKYRSLYNLSWLLIYFIQTCFTYSSFDCFSWNLQYIDFLLDLSNDKWFRSFVLKFQEWVIVNLRRRGKRKKSLKWLIRSSKQNLTVLLFPPFWIVDVYKNKYSEKKAMYIFKHVVNYGNRYFIVIPSIFYRIYEAMYFVNTIIEY